MKPAKLVLPSAETMERDFRSHHDLSGDEANFTRLAKLLLGLAGISLPANDKNRMLMAGRLAPILRKRGMSGYADYLTILESGTDPEARTEFVCALTTNTTEFFRENAHFQYLQQTLLPELLQAKQRASSRELRVWCAAASTGQEPYSILITLFENLPNPEFWELRFLATDIDMDVLQRAAEGFYSEAEMKNVPPMYRQKYFDPYSRGKASGYRVKRRFSDMIRFAPLNLLSQPYPFQHPFDIVFCRNVLIYFERQAALDVVDRIARNLRVGGHVFLGHSEVVAGKSPLLTTVSHAVYRRGGKP